MINPNISIIIPIYNAEKSLHRCIDSIVNQSYKNWELLLINDGSTDNSSTICDEYVQQDKRIKVFHKPNGGVSSARNIGLDNAKGKWITFVDSDDLLANEALCLDWPTLNEDFILFPFYFCYRNGKSDMYVLDSVGKIDNLKLFYERELGHLSFRNPWSKLFKNELIGNLRFDEQIRCGEDTLFVLNYLGKIKTCNVQRKAFYLFNQDEKEFHEKYLQSIDRAIYSLSAIYTAFEKLNIRCGNFEKNIFFDFKTCCQEEINKNASLWFDNIEIKRIFSKIKQYMGFEQRLRYSMLSIRLVSKINVLLRRRK